MSAIVAFLSSFVAILVLLTLAEITFVYRLVGTVVAERTRNYLMGIQSIKACVVLLVSIALSYNANVLLLGTPLVAIIVIMSAYVQRSPRFRAMLSNFVGGTYIVTAGIVTVVAVLLALITANAVQSFGITGLLAQI